MPFISVTRLHLASWRYFIPFAISVFQITRQIKRSPGFRSGSLGNDPQKGNWTLSAWDDMEVMRLFRNTGAHMKTMPRLLRWCDEASFVHWTAHTDALPSAAKCYRALKEHGRLSKVSRPSALYTSGYTVSAGIPTFDVQLKSRKHSGALIDTRRPKA
jgi:hypothetical protein